MKARTLFATFMSLGLTWSASSFAAYKVDPAQSSVKWVGTKVIEKLGSHSGTVKIKEGTLDLEGKQEKGRFVIDMSSITNTDLSDQKLKEKLESHLKSDDFFGVTKYPEATFVIKQLKQDAKDKTQYQVEGDLTIKGITKPVSFPAKLNEKNDKIEISSQFFIKRNEWDIRYNSPTFLDIKALGDKAIKDEISFDLSLVGQKK